MDVVVCSFPEITACHLSPAQLSHVSPQQEGGEEASVHTWGPLSPCHTDAQGGDPQTFPFSSSCSSAEGASSEDLAEAGGVKGLGVLVLSITAARAVTHAPAHLWDSQEWPWGDKPSPGAVYNTRLAIPSHQEAGVSECLHFQTVTHFS